MPTLTIRNLPDDVHAKLRVRAAEHGRSTEAEVRAILTASVEPAVTDLDRAAFEAAVDAAQAEFAAFRNPKVLASDELIAERRLEAWRDTVETNEWLAEQARRKRAG